LVERLAGSHSSDIHLIVSLSPPTSYYALKRLLWRPNVRVDFVASGLHSKLYILESSERRIAVIGSSNLTSGGLHENIETNVIFEGKQGDELEVASHFAHIAYLGQPLTPAILESYKDEYDAFVRAHS